MKNKNNYTLRMLISLIISVAIGTLFMKIFEDFQINVWIARSVGAVVTVIVGLLFYKFWIKNRKLN